MRMIAVFLLGMMTFAASPAVAADTTQQEANKKTVLEFYEAGLNRSAPGDRQGVDGASPSR